MENEKKMIFVIFSDFFQLLEISEKKYLIKIEKENFVQKKKMEWATAHFVLWDCIARRAKRKENSIAIQFLYCREGT